MVGVPTTPRLFVGPVDLPAETCCPHIAYLSFRARRASPLGLAKGKGGLPKPPGGRATTRGGAGFGTFVYVTFVVEERKGLEEEGAVLGLGHHRNEIVLV